MCELLFVQIASERKSHENNTEAAITMGLLFSAAHCRNALINV